MHTRIPTILILSLIIATTAKATTYTWSGADGNFSNPTSWTGPAPSPTGSPTDQLLFPAPADPTAPSYTITLDAPTLFSLNALTVDPAFPSTQLFTINAAPGTQASSSPAVQSHDHHPRDLRRQFLINASRPPPTSPSPATSTLTGPRLPSPPLPTSPSRATSLKTTPAPPTSTKPSSPAALGNSVLPTSFSCNLGNTTANTTLSFGTAPILLANGSFSLGVSILANSTVTMTNAIDIAGDGTLQGNGGFIPSFIENFTGPIDLNGTLHLNLQFGGTMILAGPVTLDQSNATGPAIYAPQTAGTIHITGNIIDNPAHPPTLPLSLAGPAVPAFPFGGIGLFIDGTNNTYSSGTTIYYGNVFVSANSTLGTGPVSINYPATLHPAAPTNLATGQKILVQLCSTLAISFDQDPSSLISSDSPGILALDTTFTTPLDMSKLGNGQMSLGTTANGTYAAPSLLPAADHVYRFTSASSKWPPPSPSSTAYSSTSTTSPPPPNSMADVTPSPLLIPSPAAPPSPTTSTPTPPAPSAPAPSPSARRALPTPSGELSTSPSPTSTPPILPSTSTAHSPPSAPTAPSPSATPARFSTPAACSSSATISPPIPTASPTPCPSVSIPPHSSSKASAPPPKPSATSPSPASAPSPSGIPPPATTPPPTRSCTCAAPSIPPSSTATPPPSSPPP